MDDESPPPFFLLLLLGPALNLRPMGSGAGLAGEDPKACLVDHLVLVHVVLGKGVVQGTLTGHSSRDFVTWVLAPEQ